MTETPVIQMNNFIKAEDLAARWGYHYRTILNRIWDGSIPAFKLKGQWRVKMDWVVAKENEGQVSL